MSGRLILIRHGESEANASRTFTTSPEVPLTDLGRTQARQSGEVLRRTFTPVRLLSSPYRRAVQTAELIAEILSLSVEIEPAMREQHLGELHGQPYDAALRSLGFEDQTRWAWRPPGGETLEEVRDRAAPALERIARAHAAADVVVVTHGGTLFALWSHLSGSWERARTLGNAEICVVAHDGARLREPEILPIGEP